MVVAEKVQNAVDEQDPDLGRQRPATRFRLSRGSCQRDHHITQQARLTRNGLPFSHGEGKDIGRSVFVAVLPVERVDLRIPDETDGELCLIFAHKKENAASVAPHVRESDAG